MANYLRNPFQPSMPAVSPPDFYGRSKEIEEATVGIRQSSILLEGGVGIGKTSLQSRLLMHLEGFMSENECVSIAVVGRDEIQTETGKGQSKKP
ncbi:MAG: hypothetical protein ACPGSB_11145 [Opitutales bacterium]